MIKIEKITFKEIEQFKITSIFVDFYFVLSTKIFCEAQ